MNAPLLFSGRRRILFAGLIGAALAQAVSLAATAFATRAAFSWLDETGKIPPFVLCALAGAGLAMAVIRPLFRTLAEDFGQDYARDVRLALFDHTSRTAASELKKRRAGHMAMRFIGDLAALKNWPGLGLPRLVQAAALLPAAIGVLFCLAAPFGWTGLVMTAAALVALLAGAKSLTASHRLLRARRAQLAADMAERLPLAPQLAALGRRARELRLIRKRSAALRRVALERVALAELLHGLPEALVGIAAAVILIYGSRAGLASGTIAAALAALGLSLYPLRQAMGVVNHFAAFRAAHAKLAAAFARPLRADSFRDLRLGRGPLSLSLSLPDITPLTLKPGEDGHLPETASSIVPILSGHDAAPVDGVALGGQPIGRLTLGSLRRNVAVIGPRPAVLRGSIRRALTLGVLDRPSDETIRKRLVVQNLGPVLEGLGGLDRRIAEGAADLSDADRVRLAALRAALGRPGLLVIVANLPDLSIDVWARTHPATRLWIVPCRHPDAAFGPTIRSLH
ncbi:ABC-type multidrug transport system fused ATPase/permease subunit [Sinorhizobium kostiense]|uniref:ABC-type multidrug transport system fused ATPase/permease subunit n=1 Tax=Sinorhizobium kostiense TaxID=76747 RepID=A0ABS4QW33_9HYPH|nr:ABC transporter ATP-binding protein [Sinorhizobium kostiense]MBP2234860.1 ABC-type multidrug transport system fused ATPase/permease subunit [Sinorhizobium kostiense]